MISAHCQHPPAGRRLADRAEHVEEESVPPPLIADDRPCRLARLAIVAMLLVAAPAGAGNGTIPGYGLGAQTTQYVQAGSAETRVDWPLDARPIVHLRTYDFDAHSLTSTQSEAWALGGWAGFTTGFLSDLLQVGAVGYTSQPLYAPDNKGGTKILQPNQDAINVLGEAFGALRFFDQTFVGYRQLVNRPFVNQNDSRMVPQVFEAYTLRGAPGGVSYLAGYLTKIKVRDSDSYTWMSQQAGTQAQQGMIIGGVTIPYGKGGFVRLDEQYVRDAFNTFYVDGLYPIEVDTDTTLALGAQYYPQTSVNAAQLGHFSTWGLGITGVLTWRELTAQLAYTQTGTGYDTLNPYGDHASYANLMQSAFNTAGEKAWLVGATYDFGKALTPGLTAGFNYAHGTSLVNATTGAALPNQDETNVRVDYAFAKDSALRGLSATLRYSWLHQSGSPTATQLRAYLNYEVTFR